MKALHFGAGNIGRALIGRYLRESGYELIFADINETVINELNTKHSYTVRIVGDTTQEVKINNVRGILSTDSELIDLLVESDLITTAVGPNVLNHIAPTIRQGLIKRIENNKDEKVNIIACENMIRGTSVLKKEILKELNENQLDWIDTHVGFIDSVIDGIVPPTTGEQQKLLNVSIDEFGSWIVDATQFCGAVSPISGMTLTDNLMAYLERKLFTLNTAHVIVAYLGHLKGYETIRESILDKDIRTIVHGAMKESGAFLIYKYGFAPDEHSTYIETVLKRFSNPHLNDYVTRVAREPIRKLSYQDRLIMPLLGTIKYNLPNNNLIEGVIAALKYNSNSDSQSLKLQELISTHGVADVLSKICHLDPNNQASQKIMKCFN